ncbi:T9SS type A sorting domain-containing protein, partial [bacterium AH-315-M05]|nr:T9SS type A sorting domain-containing protein [bacterium AH-315-M05]
PVVINLHNMIGQIMSTREAESSKGHRFIETFNARQLLPGLYHLEIITKRGIINRKVVVE